MNTDDFIYLSFLFFSIAFGIYYRSLGNAEIKKKTGAFMGLMIVLIVSRFHFIHIVITVFVNAYIILYVNKRYCHVISFTFSFLYLIFFRTTEYLGIPYPPSHTNLIQMILTLKLVGLAFEVNSHYIKQTQIDNSAEVKETLFENSSRYLKLDISDIFCYSVHYIGVLTGPFYKYRTYYDHLHKPFSKYDDYKTATLKKLFPLVPIFAIIYLITDHLWPLGYTTTDEFEQRHLFYRYWYIWPTFLNFRMRIYIGLILSECVCIMGGLGVYPKFAKSKSGNGPTENILKLEEVSKDEATLKTLGYDYETVLSINPYGTEFYPTLREGMRNWNITVQYWLAMCVYKRFPSKTFRTFATMFVSGVWHGVYSGYYISVGMIPFGLMVEDLWSKILLKDDFFLPTTVGYFIMVFLKMQFFSYAALAFSLLHVHKIMQYYNSVYHWMIFFCIFLYCTGLVLLKIKNGSMNKAKNLNDSENIEVD